MKKMQYSFILLMLIVSVRCKKDPVNHTPEPDYQETRRARITQVELTDKDFRQYFIYGEDGLLDSVKREGDFEYGDPLENIITVSHEPDHIRLHTIWDKFEDSYWRNAIFLHQHEKITGTEYSIRLHPFALPEIRYSSSILYNAESLIDKLYYYILTDEKDTLSYYTDIIYEDKKLLYYKSTSEYSNLIPDYSIDFTYTSQPLIPRDIIRLINNGVSNFVLIGEKSEINWMNLVYGLSGYELPLSEKDELISRIRYKEYSKEDGSLLLDSTAVFNHQVDTLNRKISFGNQIVSYEFTE